MKAKTKKLSPSPRPAAKRPAAPPAPAPVAPKAKVKATKVSRDVREDRGARQMKTGTANRSAHGK